jgi:SpoVK/Ycf46/Vps4 family AAA+-type ATPase
MAPRNREGAGLADFGEVLQPSEAQEPILARPVRASLIEWLTEIWAAKELEAVGLEPRRRALFHGAPGTGKTTLAHHLAARLGLPLVMIRPDRIVDAYLGETGKALGALFDAARPVAEGGEGPVVLFFDEFEALGAKRQADGRDAQREMNSVVNVLLQRFDAHKGFVIAATNHGDRLDSAIWRRFDMQIKLDPPGQEERERIIKRYLAPYGLPARQLADLAGSCDTATPALLRQLCDGLKRNLVIGPQVNWPMDREAVFARVLASIEPHADVGKPRLWSIGAQDRAVAGLSWPPVFADALPADAVPADPEPAQRGSVVPLRGGRP